MPFARVVIPVLLLALAPAEVSSTFTLAVVRRDGIVFPFASFDGKHWDAGWPQDLRFTEIPLTFETIPPRWWGKAKPSTEFTVWHEGRAQGTLRVDRPVLVPAACSRRIALSSNYRSKEMAPPPIVRPYPKDGLAVSGDQKVEAIGIVPPGSPEWNAVLSFLPDAMDKVEQRAIENFTEWSHPVGRKERKTIPVEIEALYRAPTDDEGWTAYHVEAIKRYAPGKNDEGCGLITSATGWAAIGPGTRHWTAMSAKITYCDRKGVSYFLPLGLMRVAGKTYWIFQSSGYDHERFHVVRPTKRDVVFEAGYIAGSCDLR